MKHEIYKSNGSCVGVWLMLFLMPSLFVVFLVLGFTHVIAFKVNIHTLSTILVIFIIYLFFIKHNARYASCKVKNNSLEMEEQMRKALDSTSLTIMDDTKSTLNIRDFLDSYFKGIRDDNFARVAASVFPMLGILGTFIAIAVSMPDFSASSSENLDKEISLLLSGIGTAFYASIYGIFLSLWWTFSERMGLAKIEKRSQALELMYGEYIWSASELIKHEHMQTEMKDKKLVEALRKTFNLDLIKEISQEQISGYKSIIAETSEQFMKVSEKMLESSQKLQETAKTIDAQKDSIYATEKLSSEIGKFIAGVDTLSRGFEQFDDSVDRTFDKIDRELAVAVDKLGEMVELTAIQKYKEE